MDEHLPISHTKSEAAKQKVRGTHGEFIHISEDPVGNDLVDLKIHNPIRKIYAAWEWFKKNQGWKYNIKGEVPLSWLIAAFLFGVGGISFLRLLSPACTTQFETRFGKFYVLSLAKPQVSSFITKFVPFISLPQDRVITQAIIREDNVSTEITLLFPLDSDVFHNQDVAISGDYNACNRTLTVKNSQNLVVLR